MFCTCRNSNLWLKYYKLEVLQLEPTCSGFRTWEPRVKLKISYRNKSANHPVIVFQHMMVLFQNFVCYSCFHAPYSFYQTLRIPRCCWILVISETPPPFMTDTLSYFGPNRIYNSTILFNECKHIRLFFFASPHNHALTMLKIPYFGKVFVTMS